jgi:predicted  nucleic acid-binding Zn-ribbon protein
MADIPLNISEIDERIATLREDLRELVEQAAAFSGAADEDLTSSRIAEQEAELELLMKRRDELSRPRP